MIVMTLPMSWKADRIPLFIFCLTVLSCFAAYQPARLYFYGDTWDLLLLFQQQGWQQVWPLHNDHFIPLSKAFLFFEYLLFGMHNLPYQVINILIHAVNAVLLYFCAAEFSSRVAPRAFGALFFGMSTVPWEVTMWETGQQISLALLFILCSLLLHARYLRRREGRLLAYLLLSALAACCAMGFGLMVVPLLMIQGAVLGRPRWKQALAGATLLGLAALACYALLLRTHYVPPHDTGHMRSLGQAAQLVRWIVTGLRDGLLVPSISTRSGPLVLGILFLAGGLLFWRAFLAVDRVLLLIVPVVMILGPYALTGVGRLELGVALAASSRYQYLPVAGLALILAWLAGGAFEIAQQRFPAALSLLALVTLLTLPAHAISSYKYVRQHSPRFLWGQQAHRFVDLAIYQRGRPPVPAGMLCAGPELYLPASMYPWLFELSRVLPMYAASGVIRDECGVGLRSVLELPEIRRANLLEGGAAGLDSVTRIEMPQATSAYSFELSCPDTSRPYTFAASARLVSGEPRVCLRVVSKDRTGNVLDSLLSRPISSHEFENVLVSAYPAEGASVVEIGFAAAPGSASPVIIEAKDAILLQHPVYLSAR